MRPTAKHQPELGDDAAADGRGGHAALSQGRRQRRGKVLVLDHAGRFVRRASEAPTQADMVSSVELATAD
ncbi:hypothetical protein BIV25_05880 [Streptomyces sp. MUSC 14]|uniref:hypothetical protein n=1 Tax=Streptomyces sp. MUSC 14 TaxID=1354889 RepID=UPI0008F5AEDB|nr:hypothetical protein [Streptomyces sp. MUSC 14]OIK01339.1 hypothetical protein BIV25_05880 [Streptomyces sp. MUSC 14]